MPRPQPIIIPGYGMSQMSNNDWAINATGTLQNLAALYDFVQRQKDRTANVEGTKALAQFLGMGQQKPVTGMTGGDTGMVNMPQQSPLDIESLAKSPIGQQAVLKQYEAKYGPMTLEKLLAGQVMQGQKSLEQAYDTKQGLAGKKELKQMDIEKSNIPNTDFKMFVAGYKEDNPNATNSDISKAWHKTKLDEQLAAAKERGKGFAYSRMVDVWDTQANGGKGGMRIRSLATTENAPEGRYYGKDDPFVIQKQSEARQRGGAVAATINTANDLYQQNLPDIIHLRDVVAGKDLLPDSQFKTYNEFKQWVMLETSDPDMAELKGKLLLMSDQLNRVFGSNQGGEWAFKVANTLMDSSLQGEAFERRLDSHADDLTKLAESRRSFGQKEPMKRKDRGGKEQSSDMDSFWK